MQSSSPPPAAQVVTRLVNLLVLAVLAGILVVAGYSYFGSKRPLEGVPTSDGELPWMLQGPGMLEGDEAFSRHEWEAAAGFYRTAVERDSFNGMAWFRLGYSLHALQRLDEAILAHAQAARFAPFRGTALYNLSCALALQGRREESLAALKDAIDAGFQSDFPVTKDPDFASLLQDAEFLPLAQMATRPASRPRPRNENPRMLDPALPADWQPPADIIGS